MPGAESSSSGATSSSPAATSPGSSRSSSPAMISRSTREARRRSASSTCRSRLFSSAAGMKTPEATTVVARDRTYHRTSRKRRCRPPIRDTGGV